MIQATQQAGQAGCSLLLSALAGEKTERIPFWLMRQAGRYLPEYRALREKAGSFLNLAFTPDYAAEVTLQPVARFDMDAAILFSDILVVPWAMGLHLDYVEGEGPQLETVTGHRDMARLDFRLKKLDPVFDAIRLVRAKLDSDKALIGFAGAPWTLACYMAEGGGSHDFLSAKAFATTAEDDFDRLIDMLTDATIDYLRAQIRAGVDAVQIFDSWAGLLPEPYFSRWCTAPASRIARAIKRDFPQVPVIGFPRGAGENYAAYARDGGVDAVSLDQDIDLARMLEKLSEKTVVQGNLDPQLLLQGGKAMEEGIIKILETAASRPFVFNLGHGVIKETPPEHVAELARIVKTYRRA